MSPFDTQVYHKHQICLRFHRILKVILEMAFSAHCSPIWKLNRISTTIINKVTRKCIWCCHRVLRCVTSPGFGVKLCSGAWKRGPDSHVGTFSLWTELARIKLQNLNQRYILNLFMLNKHCPELEVNGIVCQRLLFDYYYYNYYRCGEGTDGQLIQFVMRVVQIKVYVVVIF